MTKDFLAISTVCAAFGVVGTTPPAFAQSAISSACAILASRITPDISSQATSSSKFQVFKQIIQDDRYSSFTTANSSTLDIGITVVGYVDAFLGTTSKSDTWMTNWRKFLGATYAQASSSFDNAQFESRWSVDVIKAIVSSCPGTGGFYGLVETVTPSRDAFTISLHGTGVWKLNAISSQPSDQAFSCNGDEKATPQYPIEYVNDHIITCRKDPNLTLLITVRNSQRDVGPFTVNSIADDLRIKLSEGAAQLDAFRTQIQGLQGTLDAARMDFATQLDQLRKDLGFWNAEQKLNPPDRLANDGPISCENGYYMVGVNFKRVGSGLNWAQAVCRKISAAR